MDICRKTALDFASFFALVVVNSTFFFCLTLLELDFHVEPSTIAVAVSGAPREPEDPGPANPRRVPPFTRARAEVSRAARE